jgi:hypothetical protein
MYVTPGADGDSAERANRSDLELPIASPGTPVGAVACFDWLAFVESLGDEELAAEIVSLFVLEAPALVDRVRDAVHGTSSEELRQAAHAFKGAVGNLTRIGPMETSGRLEAMARGEIPADARALMSLLDRQVAGLLDELKAVRPPRSPCEF